MFHTANSNSFVWTLLFPLLLAGCTNRAEQCTANANCESASTDGAGGSPELSRSTNAAMPTNGGSGGASSSSSDSGGGSGGAVSGASSSAMCGNACEGSTPVCKAEANTCVECIAAEQCKDASKPYCDTDTNRCVVCANNEQCSADPTKKICDKGADAGACVECLTADSCSSNAEKPLCDAETRTCVMCLEHTDCKNANAPLCDAETHTCTGCEEDTDCAPFEGRGVCEKGACVACTPEKEGACGENSCSAEKKECTKTKRKSVGLCGACEADSECATNSGVSVARCVKMNFQDGPHGSYCLEAVSSGCEKPFGHTDILKITAESVSGALRDDYCGINQSLVTCEAIVDMEDSADNIRCGDSEGNPDAALCGCQRDADGKCIEPGFGGICADISGALRCTIQCGSGAECTTDRACKSTESPKFCG